MTARRRVLHIVRPARRGPPAGGTLSRLAARGPRDAGVQALNDSGGDAAVGLASSVMKSMTGFDHASILIGAGREGRAARLLGVHPALRVSPPLGIAPLCVDSVRRAMIDMGRPDLVVCWHPSLWPMARLEPGVPACIVDTDRGVITCERIGQGLWTHPLRVGEVPLVPHAASLEELRLRARQRLNLDLTPSGAVVAGFIGDPLHRVTGRTAVHISAMMNVAGIPVTAVMNTGAAGAERAQRHVAHGGYTSSLVATSDPMQAALPALDVALFDVPVGETLTQGELFLCMAAWSMGVPTVVPEGAGLEGLIPGEAKACLARGNDPAALARTALSVGTPGDTRRTVLEGLQAWSAARRGERAAELGLIGLLTSLACGEEACAF